MQRKIFLKNAPDVSVKHNSENENTNTNIDEKSEDDNEKKIRQFLKNIKTKPRDFQLYTDEYSQREQKLNNNIIVFNMTLPKNKFFSKRRLNYYVERYMNKLEEESLEEKRQEFLEKEKRLSPKRKPFSF